MPRSKKEIENTKNEETKSSNLPKRMGKHSTTSVIKKREIGIDEVKLEKIEEEIKKQTTIPEKRQNKINKRIFINILIAEIIIIYFIFIIMGYMKLEANTYLVDLRVFSMITIGITIIIFERAYKKDSDELAIYGIESLILSICTLMTMFIINSYKAKYIYIINSISMLFGVYYVGKSIFIYCKMRKKALKRVSDIHKIGRIKE